MSTDRHTIVSIKYGLPCTYRHTIVLIKYGLPCTYTNSNEENNQSNETLNLSWNMKMREKTGNLCKTGMITELFSEQK